MSHPTTGSCHHFCHLLLQYSPGSTSRSRPGRALLQSRQSDKVNSGHYGDTSLVGAQSGSPTVWRRLSQGQLNWALATFDKATVADERKALGEILGHDVFLVKWKSFQVGGNLDCAAAGKGNGQKPSWENVSPAPDRPRTPLESLTVTRGWLCLSDTKGATNPAMAHLVTR